MTREDAREVKIKDGTDFFNIVDILKGYKDKGELVYITLYEKKYYSDMTEDELYEKLNETISEDLRGRIEGSRTEETIHDITKDIDIDDSMDFLENIQKSRDNKTKT